MEESKPFLFVVVALSFLVFSLVIMSKFVFVHLHILLSTYFYFALLLLYIYSHSIYVHQLRTYFSSYLTVTEAIAIASVYKCAPAAYTRRESGTYANGEDQRLVIPGRARSNFGVPNFTSRRSLFSRHGDSNLPVLRSSTPIGLGFYGICGLSVGSKKVIGNGVS